MYNFRILTEQDNEINMPDGTSPDLLYFAARIRCEIYQINPALSWEAIDALAGFAVRGVEITADIGSAWYRDKLKNPLLIDKDELDFYRKCQTPEGLILMEGAGLILREWLEGADAENGNAQDWSAIEALAPDMNILPVLYAYALYRLDSALVAHALGQIQAAFGHISVAGNVVEMASEHSGREFATAHAKALYSQERQKGARLRHTETYALRKEVTEYWRDNIDKNMSAEKSATMLTKIFPLSHRTLKAYVTTEKKRPPASTK